MDIYMESGMIRSIDYVDSAGGTGQIGMSGVGELLTPGWDFEGACATGYAVATVTDIMLVFDYLKIEAELPLAF